MLTLIKSTRDAIREAKQIMSEAGYAIPRITKVEYDEDDEIYTIEASEGDIFIYIEMQKNGDVLKFETEE